MRHGGHGNYPARIARVGYAPRRARCPGCGRTQVLLSAPLSVRRWLRRAPQTHIQWLYEQAVAHAFLLDPDILVRPKPWPSLLGHGLNSLAGAALVYCRRIDPEMPPWTVIGTVTRGNLPSPPLCT